MKRAQGLPITTIVITALGLLILVILIAIVGGKFRQFGAGVSEETRVQVCHKDQIKSIYECDTPLLGDYGKNVSGKIVRMSSNEVCCSK